MEMRNKVTGLCQQLHAEGFGWKDAIDVLLNTLMHMPCLVADGEEEMARAQMVGYLRAAADHLESGDFNL